MYFLSAVASALFTANPMLHFCKEAVARHKHRGRCGFFSSKTTCIVQPHERRKLLGHRTVSKMALASVLQSDCADFSFGNCQPFGYGPGQSSLGFEATPGDNLSFSVRNPLCAVAEDDVERKIEFLHGTTTLAFKVSQRITLGPCS